MHTSLAVTTAVVTAFTDDTLTAAAHLAANTYRPVWTGPSGETSTGEAVARHLEATIALLGQDGWVRTYDYGKEWSANATKELAALAADDSTTVPDMLRALLRVLHDEAGTDPRRTLSMALRHTGESTHGDPDTAAIGAEVLDLLIRAHTGTDTARATAWSERLHRTVDDINALLTAGARFARAYGPAPTAAHAA
jgi:hypothetical protein